MSIEISKQFTSRKYFQCREDFSTTTIARHHDTQVRIMQGCVTRWNDVQDSVKGFISVCLHLFFAASSMFVSLKRGTEPNRRQTRVYSAPDTPTSYRVPTWQTHFNDAGWSSRQDKGYTSANACQERSHISRLFITDLSDAEIYHRRLIKTYFFEGN